MRAITSAAPSASDTAFDTALHRARSSAIDGGTAPDANAGVWSISHREGSVEATGGHDEFDRESDAAHAAREAARELARGIPPEVHDDLLQEHGDLVEKQLLSGLSKREATRLRYVRWQLSRIEDAHVGEHLDRLEALATLHEQIAEDIASFADHAADVSSRWRKPTKRGR